MKRKRFFEEIIWYTGFSLVDRGEESEAREIVDTGGDLANNVRGAATIMEITIETSTCNELWTLSLVRIASNNRTGTEMCLQRETVLDHCTSRHFGTVFNAPTESRFKIVGLILISFHFYPLHQVTIILYTRRIFMWRNVLRLARKEIFPAIARIFRVFFFATFVIKKHLKTIAK